MDEKLSWFAFACDELRSVPDVERVTMRVQVCSCEAWMRCQHVCAWQTAVIS